MVKRSRSDALLHLLVRHPFLSSRQMARITGITEHAIEQRLVGLRKKGLLETVDPKEPTLRIRSLHLPTAQGLARLAELERVSPQDVARTAGLSRGRLATLGVRVGTAYQARQLLLGLAGIASLMSGWRCMARIRTDHGSLVLDGAATFKYQGRLLQVALELDAGARATRQVEKLYQLLELYPALQLVVVCWSKSSMQHYLDLIRREALSRQAPLLPAYIALGQAIRRQGYNASIWYSNYAGCYTRIFQVSIPPARFVQPWPPPEEGSFANVLSPSVDRLVHLATQSPPPNIPLWQRLVGLGFALSPLQKRLLALVASHPLVNEVDLAALSQATPGYVHAAVEKLLEWEILVVSSYDELGRRLLKLAPLGIAYLARREGWGRGIKSYARSRGWKLRKDGSLSTDRLEKNLRHTRDVHSLLVKFSRHPRIEIARWTSEPSTGLCFIHRGRQYRIQPDASGLLRLAGKDLPFILEWERSTTSIRKLAAKLRQYYHLYCAGQHRTLHPDVRLLMITTGRRRAQRIIQVTKRLAQELDTDPLPLLVTSYKELATRGPLAPIWQAADGSEAVRLVDYAY